MLRSPSPSSRGFSEELPDCTAAFANGRNIKQLSAHALEKRSGGFARELACTKQKTGRQELTGKSEHRRGHFHNTVTRSDLLSLREVVYQPRNL